MKKLLLIIICLFLVTGCVKSEEEPKEETPKKETSENKSLACHMDENGIRATVNIKFNDKDATESASFIVKTSLKDMYGDIDITDEMKEGLITDLAIEFNEVYNVEYIDSSIDGDSVEISFSPYIDGEYTLFDDVESSIDGYENLLNELDSQGFICEKNGIKDVIITDTITCSTTVGDVSEEFIFDFNQNKDLLRAFIVAKQKLKEPAEDGYLTQKEIKDTLDDNIFISGTPKVYIFNNEVTMIVSVYDTYYKLLKLNEKDDQFYTRFKQGLELGPFVCQ